MLDFAFSEEQELFRSSVRSLAQEIGLGYRERAADYQYSWEVHKKLANLGLTGLRIPEAYGGQGKADKITIGIAIEEIARADPSYWDAILYAATTADIILEHLPSFADIWLPKVAAGDAIFNVALTEPQAGTDAAAIKMTAVKKGGNYVLKGEKTAITYGMPAQGAFVFCKTNPELGSRGVSLFLVEMDRPGVSKFHYKGMGQKPLGWATLVFDDVEVPSKNLIGEENKGFRIAMQTFDWWRPLIGLACTATAQASLEETIEYAKKRTAFGQPISKFEGVAFKLAEDATSLECARWMGYRALWLADKGVSHAKESAMAKLYGTKVAAKTIYDCIITQGHYGYSSDSQLQERLKDVLGYHLGDGSPEAQKIVIARSLFGGEFSP